jgi:hypothetical protein
MSAVNDGSLRYRLSAGIISSISKDCKWEVNAAPHSQIGEAASLCIAGARNGRASSGSPRLVPNNRRRWLIPDGQTIEVAVTFFFEPIRAADLMRIPKEMKAVVHQESNGDNRHNKTRIDNRC